MDILSAQNISFTYPDAEESALSNINFSIKNGDFIVLCGPSGSGKSTLLRLIKCDIAPHGLQQGDVFYKKNKIKQYEPLERAQYFGMVFQNPDQQIVMDSVMDELLFGLENLGVSTAQMRKKVAEMVHFFDINHLLERKVQELSGGEKQLVNLASVLLMDPDVLLLDEPTGQLDPVASREFIHILEQLNDEFGITIIVVEHRLEELFSIVDKVMVLERGQITHFDETNQVIGYLAEESRLNRYLPSTSKLFLAYNADLNHECIPISVKETKQWLEAQTVTTAQHLNTQFEKDHDCILYLHNIDFQYEPYRALILNNVSMDIRKGEWHAIIGANGTGKSTLLKVISGILKPQHGHMKFNGKKLKKIEPGIMGYLPQSPELFFVQDTLIKEYRSIAAAFQIDNADSIIEALLIKFALQSCQDKHPYDLSGGELQKAALIGALLVNPPLLLIDEPTKGLDPDSKEQLGSILQSLIEEKGLSIIMVTHDVEFAAAHATRCSMLFQGQITVTENTRSFFQENMYYTTVMNRITRKMDVPSVVTLEEAKRKWHMPNTI